ncbi:hypothetical protein [Thermoclostridium caenicola]|uniref:Uncharacterized protein n=1 Tax=Thermoclostridium caenicola TaxID=659425 RepID=A0A1M6KII9_9FIRM|nr:hypothetical protein [Thermoclostridium caenicola]SHJ58763.1 hypothetical protein SAMN05444373_10813 [Thermoclostridium caenicola]
MIKYEIFDGSKTYMFPSGEIATPDKIRSQFPAVDMFPHVLELNGPVVQAVMSLDALRSLHNIDPSISDEQAIQILEDIANTPVPVEPSAEERIAAALEFQNMMMLPDAE